MKQVKQPEKRTPFSWKFLLPFFLCIFTFLSLFSSGNFDSEDGWLYLNVARNIYYKHQIIANPATDYPEHNVNMNSMKGEDGLWRAPGAIGYSFSMVPAVALSDLFHRYYGSTPPRYFPLESDWTVLFFASFTNIFWASLLAVLLLLYAYEIGWSKKEAIVFTLLTIFTTNLFPMAKFSFAQMIYTFFMMLTFFFVRKFALQKRLLWFLAILVSVFCLIFAYNVSYYLAFGPLGLYYLFLHEGKARRNEFLKLAVLGLIVVISKFSLVISIPGFFRSSMKVLFEGVWGFLFSSGKSIFLYSPLFLLLPMFWHKIRKEITPELIGFGSLALFFLIFLGSAWIPNPVGKTPIWYGGMVWGPRYFAPVIPGLMIITFHILKQLNVWQKRFIVAPLIALAISVQLVGSSVIYLLQYTDIPFSIFIKQEEISVYDYASFIPRYSPMLKQAHVVAALAYRFPGTIYHGPYNVKFYDGFDVPLHVGGNRTFRGFREEAHISFQQVGNDKPKTLSMILENVPDIASSSAQTQLVIHSKQKGISSFALEPHKETTVTLNPQEFSWKENESYLDLYAAYVSTPSAPHVVYIKKMEIDGSSVNLASLDYPELSSINKNFTPIEYQYYGGKVTAPWKFWDLRARINERTFDFWWVKNFYYWDRLRTLLWALLGLDIGVLVIGLWVLVRQYNKEIQ